MRSEMKQIRSSFLRKKRQDRILEMDRYYTTFGKREASHSSMLCKTGDLKSRGAVLCVPPCSLRDRVSLLACRETKKNAFDHLVFDHLSAESLNLPWQSLLSQCMSKLIAAP